MPPPRPPTDPVGREPHPAAVEPRWRLLSGMAAVFAVTGSAMYLGLSWQSATWSPVVPQVLARLVTQPIPDVWFAMASVYLPAGFGIALGLAARLGPWRVVALGVLSLLAYNLAAGVFFIVPQRLVALAAGGATGALLLLLALALVRWRRPSGRAIGIVAGTGAAGGLAWLLFADNVTPRWIGIPLAFLAWHLPVGLTVVDTTDLRAATHAPAVRWRMLAGLAGVLALLSAAAAGRRATLAATAPGTTAINPADDRPYVWIPPGRFDMGCSPGDASCESDERPARPIRFTKGFWMGQHEVRVADWKRRNGPLPSAPIWRQRTLNPEWADGQMPMIMITWAEAGEYCGAVDGRLPTEAEWEYAARAGTTAQRYGPLSEIAWYADNTGVDPSFRSQGQSTQSYEDAVAANRSTPQRVGTRRPNAWSLHDMLGNVAEWTADDYRATYPGLPVTDPIAHRSGLPDAPKVVRGGSWYNRPSIVRVSYRGRVESGRRIITTGFRCIWNRPPA
jgi:formylglycine-generating enzyme required for sulfatase activity